MHFRRMSNDKIADSSIWSLTENIWQNIHEKRKNNIKTIKKKKIAIKKTLLLSDVSVDIAERNDSETRRGK